MKTNYRNLILGILLSLLLTNISFAQDFAPLGAKWYFPATSWWGNSIQLMTYESVGDTMINDKPCRVLYKNLNTLHGASDNYYFYQSSDSIFHYDESNDKFDLIIVQSAMPGDTFLIEKSMGYQYSDSMDCIVDSISYINIDDEDSLRVQHVRLVSDLVIQYDTFTSEYHRRIIERVGFDYGLLPVELVWLVDGILTEGYVRCYEDSEVGLLSFSNVDCLYTPVGELEDLNAIVVYPNPVYETLFLEVPGIVTDWICTIYDIHGKELRTQKNVSDQRGGIIEKDVSDCPPSMYFITLTNKENQIYYSTKFLKR